MGTSTSPIRHDDSPATEQRQYTRKTLSDPIAIELLPGQKAQLQDVSEGGFGVLGCSSLEPGADTSIYLDVPESDGIIEAKGVVAWSDASGRAGVRFTHLEPLSTALLRRWLDSGASTQPASSDTPLHDADLAAKITSLREVADLQAIISSEGLERAAALDLIVRRMAELTRSSGAAIALREGPNVVCRASFGNAPDVGVKLSLSSLSGECLQTGKIVLLEDSEADSRVNPEVCRQLNFRSLLILPVASENETIGIAEVLSPQVRNFEGGDVLVLSFFTDLIAAVAPPQTKLEKSAVPEPLKIHHAATEPVNARPPQIPLPRISKPMIPAVAPNTRAAAAIPYVVNRPVSPAKQIQTSFGRDIQAFGLVRRILPVTSLILLLVIGSAFSSYYFLRTPAGRTSSAPGVATALSTTMKQAPTTSSSESAPLVTSEVVPAGLKSSRSAPSHESKTVAVRHGDAVAPAELRVIQGRTVGVRPAPDAAPEPLAISALGARSPESLSAAIIAPKPATPELQLTQSQGVIPGKLLKKVLPRFPEMARRAGVSGDVVISGIIGTDGALHNLKVVSGSPLLRDEALTAAKQWRYSPYVLGGKPVETDTHITISFHR